MEKAIHQQLDHEFFQALKELESFGLACDSETNPAARIFCACIEAVESDGATKNKDTSSDKLKR